MALVSPFFPIFIVLGMYNFACRQKTRIFSCWDIRYTSNGDRFLRETLHKFLVCRLDWYWWWKFPFILFPWWNIFPIQWCIIFNLRFPWLLQKRIDVSNYYDYITARILGPSRYLGQMEGLTENSKPIYEVCDSKSGKSAPMYCFEESPLRSPGSWDWPTSWSLSRDLW